jgi:hypothetical protein
MSVIGSGITDLHVSTLEWENEEQIEEVKIKVKDEMLSQLSVHIINDIPVKAFMKQLVEWETY